VIINIHAHLEDDQDIDQRVEHYRTPDMARVVLCGGNASVKEALERYPDFVVGFAVIRLGKDRPEVVERFSEEGFQGLKMTTPTAPYDSEEFYPFYEKAQRLGMPILFHTGFLRAPVPLKIFWMHPLCLDTLARAFPELKMIGAHLGSPWYREACSAANHHRNVYFDLAGSQLRAMPLSFFKELFKYRSVGGVSDEPRGDRHRLFDESINMHLLDKICYGSDTPAPEIMVEFHRDLHRALNVPKEVEEHIWWRNAAQILGLTELL